MTQDTARKTREFSARAGVYTGGGLRIACKDSDFRFEKELRVSRISTKDDEVTWKQGNFVFGKSSKEIPMEIVVGGIRLEVTTSLVNNQHGVKVVCTISGVVPEDLYDVFSVKPVDYSSPKKRKRRK